MTEKEVDIFEKRPVFNSILTLAIPTVISQLVTVIYNAADTFFIGQIGDPNQVAATNLSLPFFFLINAFANLFGIGGASLISRTLGEGNNEKAKRVSAFTIWTFVVVSILYGIIVYFISPHLFPLFGADDLTFPYCRQYVFWTVTIGALPSVANMVFAHLVRSEGYSKQASFGMVLGAVINMLLDPLFILVFKLEIQGAAIATMISNTIATSYFIIYLLIKRKKTVITLNPKYYSGKDGIAKEVLLTGLPSATMSVMVACSNLTLNKLMSGYGNEAIAGVGIARKIDLVTLGITLGISQGVVPLIGYNYAQGNYKRMNKTIKTTFRIILVVALTCMLLLFTLAHPIVKFFIDDETTVTFGEAFQRIICLSGLSVAMAIFITSTFQAVGKKIQPLIISLLRKGFLDIPIMILLNHLVGVYGIVWAMPIADTLGMTIAVILVIPFLKKMRHAQKEDIVEKVEDNTTTKRETL